MTGIPGLKDRVEDYALRDAPKTIVAAGNRELHGTAATGSSHGIIVDQTGKTHRVWFPSLIVSGLGLQVFFSSVAMKPGVVTILEEVNPRLQKSGVVTPLQEQEEDLGLIQLKWRLMQTHKVSSPGSCAAALF